MVWSLKLQLATMLQWVENGVSATLGSYLSPGRNAFFAPEAALGSEHKGYSILSRGTAFIHICTMLTAVCVVPGLAGKALPAMFTHCLQAPETTL